MNYNEALKAATDAIQEYLNSAKENNIPEDQVNMVRDLTFKVYDIAFDQGKKRGEGEKHIDKPALTEVHPTRVEVIDYTGMQVYGGGRVFTARSEDIEVRHQFQDEGRTLKVFIRDIDR